MRRARWAAILLCLGAISGAGYWYLSDSDDGPLSCYHPEAVRELEVTVNGGEPPDELAADGSLLVVVRFQLPEAATVKDSQVVALLAREREGYSGEESSAPLFRHFPAGDGPRLQFTAMVNGASVDQTPPPPRKGDPALQFVGRLSASTQPDLVVTPQPSELHLWVYPQRDDGTTDWQGGSLVYVHSLRVIPAERPVLRE